MEEMYSNNRQIDTGKYSKETRYDYYDSQGVYRKNWGVYDITDGCTWYAYNRYQEMNPNIGSMFAGGGGVDTKNWVNSIDKSKFDVNSTSDYSKIQLNSIAVSTKSKEYEEGMRGPLGNHVAYIEAVNDGYVYYTDGAYGEEPESNYGRVYKVPIDVFFSRL